MYRVFLKFTSAKQIESTVFRFYDRFAGFEPTDEINKESVNTTCLTHL